MSEIPEKYTIDNAKNDIQNLQDQNKYDFQEIKRLDNLIKEYDEIISQSINLYVFLPVGKPVVDWLAASSLNFLSQLIPPVINIYGIVKS